MTRLLRRLLLTVSLACGLAGFTQAHPAGGIVVDGEGNVLFTFVNPIAGGGHRACIWRISRDGQLEEVYTSAHDPSDLILTRGLDGGVYAGERRYLGERGGKDVYESRLLRIEGGSVRTVLPPTTDPTAFSAEVIAVDRSGRVLFTAGRELRERPASKDGVARRLALKPRAGAAALRRITALRFQADGALLVLDTDALHRARPDGTYETLAAELRERRPSELPWRGANLLFDVDVDATGTPFVAYFGGRRVLRVQDGGEVTVGLRSEAPWAPHGLCRSEQGIYVLESSHGNDAILPRVRHLGKDGVKVLYGG